MKITARIGGVALAMVISAGASLPGASSGQEPAPGQQGPSRPAILRVGLDLGAGVMGGDEGALAGRLGVSFSRSWGVLTIRNAALTEFNLFGPSPAESVGDFGVLYGRETRGKWGYAAASAGLAWVTGVRRGARRSPTESCGDVYSCLGAIFDPVRYEPLTFNTVGIPIDLEVGFTFTRWLGLNAGVWANLNGERSMTGASVGIVVGRLR